MIEFKSRTNKSIILEQMPQICEWVKLGHKITSIYEALKDDGVITCGLSNFRTHYYQALKSESEAPPPAASTPAAVPKAAVKPVTKPPVAVQPAAAEFAYPDDLKSNEPEINEPDQKKTESVLSIESDLEIQRSIARMVFAENRNKQKRRRRRK